MLGVTVLAVMKVVIAIGIGAYTSRSIPDAATTLRAFSFILANILLPCLTFYFTATSVTLDLLSQCFILILFAMLLIGLGVVSAMVASRFLFRVKCAGIPHELRDSIRYELLFPDAECQNVKEGKKEEQQQQQKKQQEAKRRPVVCVVVGGALEAQRLEAEEVLPLLEPPGVEYEEQPFYHYASIMACSMQNSVTLPLSLLQALAASLPWIDLAVGASYIFVYSVVVSTFLWSMGPMLVGRAKRETDKRCKIRELMKIHSKLQACRDVATQTEVCNGISWMTSPQISEAEPLLHPSEAAEATATTQTITREEGWDIDRDAAVISSGCAGAQRDKQSVLAHGFLVETPATCEIFNYNWRERGLVRFLYAQEFQEEVMRKQQQQQQQQEQEQEDCSCFFALRHGVKSTVVQLMQTPSFVSVVMGVVVGVTPPLRWLVMEGPLTMLMESIELLSRGSIPSSLLLLGANLVGTSMTMHVVQQVRFREAEQNTEFPLDDKGVDPGYASIYNMRHKTIEFDEHASFTLASLQKQQQQQQGHVLVGTDEASVSVPANRGPVASESDGSGAGGLLDSLCRAFSLRGVRKSFVFGVIIIRLLCIPSIGFALVLLLRMAAPSLLGGVKQHDVLLLVLLGELSAPTAINCTILFNTREYMPGMWSKMLFYEYIASMLTLVLWCTLSLHIVE